MQQTKLQQLSNLINKPLLVRFCATDKVDILQQSSIELAVV
jgi:hypothetical protein